MKTEEKKFFTMSIDDTAKALNSSKTGLTNEEANKRLEEYGYNKLEEKKKKGVIAKFIDQFKDLMIIVLLFAAGISAFVANEWIDAGIILAVVVVNAILGVIVVIALIIIVVWMFAYAKKCR